MPAIDRSELLVAVSTVILALAPSRRSGPTDLVPWIPLVRRVVEPDRGRWALPGGTLLQDLTLEDSAGSTLRTITGLEPSWLEQLYTFGGLDRDLDGSPDEQRVVSVVYWASLPASEVDPRADGLRENVEWFEASALPPLAFDHDVIVEHALRRLRDKVAWSRIAYAFLGPEFTLTELRGVHEAVLGRRIDPANFRRSLLSTGAVVDTGRRREGAPHRPPRLFRAADAHDVGDPEADRPKDS